MIILFIEKYCLCIIYAAVFEMWQDKCLEVVINCMFEYFMSIFKNHQEIWLEMAEKLTDAVQQIIEFAKMVPGFINLIQDDQIMLLKGGAFLWYWDFA